MIRRPCVAGQFYPGEPERLRAALKEYISPKAARKAVAIIVPHAGYIYSGPVAGAVFSEVAIPDDVILIGPNHTGLGAPVSLMAEGIWETPLGKVNINQELASLLLASSKLISNDAGAHTREHSLEVQLPFIQTLNKNASIAPITVMHTGPSGCAAIGKAIAGAIKEWGREVLIVISSDMNHYEDEETTRVKDRLAIDKVLALEPDGLLEVTARKDITMCGAVPAAIGINAALALGAAKTRLVAHTTSGEVSGDFEQVVGYAGIIIE